MEGKTLIFGAGWLGTLFAEEIPGATLVETDIAEEAALAGELDRQAPARVINCAGRTGRPNIDALESEPGRTYRSNVVGPILLGSACLERGIHFTHLSSGCVYEGDNGGPGFFEEDPPNFDGSLYARSKAAAETALRDLDALQLRIRLPISSEPAERNLLTKLLAFDQVIHIANSITVLDDFWGPACKLIERAETGVWNMVNDGVEWHDLLLELWKDRVDPSHRFEIVEQHVLQNRLTARRSNCVLSTAKLARAGLSMPKLDEALPRIVDAYGAHLKAGN